MTADVVEENEVKTGRRDEGTFFAANIFVRKCATGLGILLTSALLTLAGFPEKAIPGSVPEPVITLLIKYFIGAFIILNAAVIFCARSFKVTRARHAENLAVIAKRREQGTAAR